MYDVINDRNPGGFEEAPSQDQYVIMEGVAGVAVAKKIPADCLPRMLILQELLDNNGKYRKLQQVQGMTNFGLKPL